MRLDGVGFRYRRRTPWVLREVSLTLPRGGIVEVSGRNGSGKSTLLRLLAGVLRPGAGRVLGRPARVGYAPEFFPARQPFTAAAYLTHMARVRAVPDPARALERWVEPLHLGPLLAVPLAELSKGSAHKIGLTQALLAEPELLVLDEPFAGLDAQTRARLPGLLAELAAGGTTIVASDHGGELRGLAGIACVRVAGRTVTAARVPADLTGDGSEPNGDADEYAPREPAPRAVIELVVDAGEAGAVAADLRALGYEVRDPRPEPRGAHSPGPR